MIINVGSKNPVKVVAVAELINDYDVLRGAEVRAVEASSDITHQPRSLEETVRGAKNRSKNAFSNCDLSFGIESGFMTVPETKSGYMNVTVCAIFDGTTHHLGTSSGFEIPIRATKILAATDCELDDALFQSGITDDPRIGYHNGIIDTLTNGRIDRKAYTQQAIRMALIHLEHPHLYQ